MNNNNNKRTEIINLGIQELKSEDQKSSSLNFKKYLTYFIKKKYLIITVAIITTALWIVLYTLFQDKFISYDTSVIIRFDDPRLERNIGAVTDFTAGSGTRSKVAVLSTNNFLGRVVDSLHLNLVIETDGIKRTDFLKKVNDIGNLREGTYNFYVSQDTLTIFYSNKKLGVKLQQLYKLIINDDPVIRVKEEGIDITVYDQVLRNYDHIELNLIPRRLAINLLRDNLGVELDRSTTILTITYTNKDPEFSAIVSNTIGELFIKQLWDYDRYQTLSILNSLEEQLEVAQKELSLTERKLRDFREKNPRVSLRDDNQDLINRIASNETQLYRLRKSYEELNSIIKKRDGMKDPDKINNMYQEALILLSDQKVVGASVLLENYKEELEERESLLATNLSLTHPQIVEIDNRLKELQEDVDIRMKEHLTQLNSQIRSARGAINSANYNLKRLPAAELSLAELTRNHQIQENILSNIMTRYNEAKVSDAAIIPDAYIIDSAQPPLIENSLITKLLIYASGLVFGGIVGICFMFIVGLFDPRLWISDEVEKKISLPILATIPLIGKESELVDYKSISAIDPKLITSDYSPTQGGEAFRRLRTVIELGKEKSNNVILFGSLKPNEGKSLVTSNVAITFAQKKCKTILLDGDIRRGVIHSSFACKKNPGLTEILTGNDKFDMKYISRFVQDTHIPNLYIISSGQPIPNPSEILGTPRMSDLLKFLEGQYDKIMIDSPPFSLCPDLFVLNMLVHNIVIILRYQKTNLSDLNKYLTEFSESRKDVRGVVINASNEKLERKGSYQYSYYNY